ncbi:hypothetical protein UFOVP1040_59 [uncultured Caudovirales phage]|uniref:Uncharacterized protein n=1 Tax=uncultured Caudovirales phage TaxID=2100421 RepID=A0A6J5Q6X7_9CAUD|nr:hypothetical protein UFOVP1040_59 [uncultured Caudovirales phage]
MRDRSMNLTRAKRERRIHLLTIAVRRRHQKWGARFRQRMRDTAMTTADLFGDLRTFLRAGGKRNPPQPAKPAAKPIRAVSRTR